MPSPPPGLPFPSLAAGRPVPPHTHPPRLAAPQRRGLGEGRGAAARSIASPGCSAVRAARGGWRRQPGAPGSRAARHGPAPRRRANAGKPQRHGAPLHPPQPRAPRYGERRGRSSPRSGPGTRAVCRPRRRARTHLRLPAPPLVPRPPGSAEPRPAAAARPPCARGAGPGSGSAAAMATAGGAGPPGGERRGGVGGEKPLFGVPSGSVRAPRHGCGVLGVTERRPFV